MESVEIHGVKAKVARTFTERARGLIGTAKPPPGEGKAWPKRRSPSHTCARKSLFSLVSRLYLLSIRTSHEESFLFA